MECDQGGDVVTRIEEAIRDGWVETLQLNSIFSCSLTRLLQQSKGLLRGILEFLGELAISVGTKCKMCWHKSVLKTDFCGLTLLLALNLVGKDSLAHVLPRHSSRQIPVCVDRTEPPRRQDRAPANACVPPAVGRTPGERVIGRVSAFWVALSGKAGRGRCARGRSDRAGCGATQLARSSLSTAMGGDRYPAIR